MKKREREEAKKRWRQERRLRTWRAAEITKLEKLDLPKAQLEERLNELELWTETQLEKLGYRTFRQS